MKSARSQRFSRPSGSTGTRRTSSRATARRPALPADLGACTDRLDPTDDLMARDERQLRLGQLPVDDVEVRPAHAAGGDPQQHLARARNRVRQPGRAESAARLVEHHRTHGRTVGAGYIRPLRLGGSSHTSGRAHSRAPWISGSARPPRRAGRAATRASAAGTSCGRPSSAIVAGTSTQRTMVASSRTATPSPKPICWNITSSPGREAAEHRDHDQRRAGDDAPRSRPTPNSMAPRVVAGLVVVLADPADSRKTW